MGEREIFQLQRSEISPHLRLGDGRAGRLTIVIADADSQEHLRQFCRPQVHRFRICFAPELRKDLLGPFGCCVQFRGMCRSGVQVPTISAKSFGRSYHTGQVHFLRRYPRIAILGLAGFACVTAIFPQVALKAFEVASIKATPPDWKGGRFITLRGSEFIARNHTLMTLIAAAYNLSPKAISGGPAWLNSEHFDISAKPPGDVRPNLEEQMAMLRQLLGERFELTFHREPAELPIFALTVAKNGPKLRQPEGVQDGPPAPLIFVLSTKGVTLPGRNASMGELASVMQRAALDRPVIDRTGLSGRFDFDLEWNPNETQFGGQGPKEDPESDKPDLFAAIQQQLGLKLEATKGMVDALVIDSAKRPSDN